MQIFLQKVHVVFFFSSFFSDVSFPSTSLDFFSVIAFSGVSQRRNFKFTKITTKKVLQKNRVEKEKVLQKNRQKSKSKTKTDFFLDFFNQVFGRFSVSVGVSGERSPKTPQKNQKINLTLDLFWPLTRPCIPGVTGFVFGGSLAAALYSLSTSPEAPEAPEAESRLVAKAGRCWLLVVSASSRQPGSPGSTPHTALLACLYICLPVTLLLYLRPPGNCSGACNIICEPTG
jgi:hypothetical protein